MLKFKRNEGGWKYTSLCGKFAIVNLSKIDSDAKGWVLRDSREEWLGTFSTLKEAKERANDF